MHLYFYFCLKHCFAIVHATSLREFFFIIVLDILSLYLAIDSNRPFVDGIVDCAIEILLAGECHRMADYRY